MKTWLFLLSSFTVGMGIALFTRCQQIDRLETRLDRDERDVRTFLQVIREPNMPHVWGTNLMLPLAHSFPVAIPATNTIPAMLKGPKKITIEMWNTN